MKKFQVERHDGNTGKVTPCGSPVKTSAKATDRYNQVRVSARTTQPGHSNWYTIKEV